MKALKIAGVALLVVVAAIAGVTAVGIPVAFLIAPVKSQIESAIGYRLEVGGGSSLALWPSTRIVVRDATLTDPTGTKSPESISAERVEATVSLASLFRGKPRVSELVITHPTIHVPLRRNRIANAGTSQSGSNTSSSSAAKQDFPLERVVVEDGSVVMANAAEHAQSQIDHVALNATFTADGSFDVTVQGRWGDQPIKLAASGDASAATLGTRPVPVKLSFVAPGVLEDELAGSADVRVAGSTLRIDNLAGTLGQGKIVGHISVDFANKPLVRGDVDIQRLNLVAAKSGSGASTSGDTSTRGDPAEPWSDQNAELNALRFFDADVHVTIAQFNYGDFRLAPASIQASLDSGMLKADFPQVGLYDGQAGGTLLLDVTDVEPNEALRLNLSGVRALPMLTDLANFSSLDGRLQAKIDVHAAGASPHAVISTLGGSTDVTIQDGEIRGINVAQMVRSLTGTTLNGWQAQRAEKTDLTALTVSFRLSSGRATTQNLQMQGPLVRMTGAGTADINGKTLDFKLEPKLVMSLEGQGGASNLAGLGVPVVVKGEWSAPRIYPDVAGIFDNPDAAFEQLKKFGGALLANPSGKPGEVQIPNLGTLFGRKSPDSKNNNGTDAKTPDIGGILQNLLGR